MAANAIVRVLPAAPCLSALSRLPFAEPAALLVAQAYFSKEVKPGVSVRDHLTELIHKLLLSKDADALEKLESLSLELKKTKVGAPEKAMVRAASAAAAPAASHHCLAPPLPLCVAAASATARSERALTRSAWRRILAGASEGDAGRCGDDAAILWRRCDGAVGAVAQGQQEAVRRGARERAHELSSGAALADAHV